MNCFKMPVKKGVNTTTQRIHPDVVPTKCADMALGTTIAFRLLGWSDETVGKSVCWYVITRIERPYNRLWHPKLVPTQPSIPMSGKLTTTCLKSVEFTKPFVINRGNGYGLKMRMGMACGKSTTTRWKTSGPACATSCVLSEGSTNSI